MRTFDFQDLRARYETIASVAYADCSLATELVGGLSADEDGIRAFVTHHLKLTGDEIENAVQRILKEELGEREVPSDEGELKEKLTYGVNIIRRDEHGPYLGSWMAKACLKNAASRLEIFSKMRGTKGDISEMGEVHAYGVSLLDPDSPEKIYLRDPTGQSPAKTEFRSFKGRIQSPQGSASIIHDSEVALVGSRFEFAFRFYGKRIKSDDVVDMFASAMVIGLGSCRSFERGKFKINKLGFQEGVIPRRSSKEPERELDVAAVA